MMRRRSIRASRAASRPKFDSGTRARTTRPLSRRELEHPRPWPRRLLGDATATNVDTTVSWLGIAIGGEPQSLNVWLIREAERGTVVDTGLRPAATSKAGRAAQVGVPGGAPMNACSSTICGPVVGALPVTGCAKTGARLQMSRLEGRLHCKSAMPVVPIPGRSHGWSRDVGLLDDGVSQAGGLRYRSPWETMMLAIQQAINITLQDW